MKIQIQKLVLAFALCGAALSLRAQGTAFTYQGRLNDTNGPARGTYDITLTLFNASTGGAIIGPSNVVSGLLVTNGLFTVTPDFGPQFSGLDRWLEIAVRTNGGGAFSLLSPRQKLTPTPYALYAPQAGTATTAFGVTADAVGVAGLQSSSVTSAKIADGSITAADVNSASFSNTFWKVNGNAGANPTNSAFLGTTDNLPVEIRVNGARALRLEPTVFPEIVNVVGGSPRNLVTNGAVGATIWGGGADEFGDYGNTVAGTYGTVSGGRQNSANNAETTVAGGRANTASGLNSTVSGGYANTVSGAYGSIGGGIFNLLTSADHATIGGGYQNTIQSNAVRGTVGGGFVNTVGAPEGTVAGGAFNNALGFSATIGGGGGNTASGDWSTIAGGRDNRLANALYATIGGGAGNAIQTNAANSTIGGGQFNTIQTGAGDTAIGGGVQNAIQSNAFTATIGGGAYNTVRSNSWRGTVGGGFVNTVGMPEGTVAGGAFNSALGFSSTIGGGGGNAASGDWSIIAGGRDNQLLNAPYATIGGGVQNTIQSNGFAATIPGGWLNSATNFAFAAGYRAKANYTGAFVWADSTDADFASTAANQFNVRAGGGVRLETGGAGMTLDGLNVLSGIVPGASLAGTYSGAVAFNNSGNSFTGNGANLTALNASQLISGTVPDARLSANVSLLGSSIASAEIVDGTIAAVDVNAASFNTTFWRTAGNAGTTPGTHFLGTTDNQPLEFKVNGARALRLEPTASTDTVNVIGGSAQNSVGLGLEGATIAGGGIGLFPNKITASYATIGGGTSNNASAGWATIAGGRDNKALGDHSTVPGGRLNTASGSYSTAMGAQTIASGYAATAMGRLTVASNDDATAMGLGSIASGWDSTAMGTYTVAGGHYSFAAGYYAQSTNQGSFVWADSTSVTPFASTASNQFLIRAGGGVGLGTPNPQAQLHLYSQTPVTTLRLQSAFGFGAGRIEFLSDPQGSGTEWRPGYVQSVDNGGFTGGLTFVVNGTGFANRFAEVEVMRIVNGRVGIGTNNPQSALHVIGTVTATAFNPPSDRNLKENFSPVSPRDVLDKIATMPITRWNFKGDAATPHVGPMAQDFHAAFGLGTDDKHIATVDADGVALAAIQGLNEVVKEKDAEIQELKRAVKELKESFGKFVRSSPQHTSAVEAKGNQP